MKLFELFAKGMVDAGQVGIPQTDIDRSVTAILNQVYFWGGMIAVLIIVVAGIMFVTSAGNPENVKKAKNAIMGAAIGLVVIILAFSITAFVTQNLR